VRCDFEVVGVVVVEDWVAPVSVVVVVVVLVGGAVVEIELMEFGIVEEVRGLGSFVVAVVVVEVRELGNFVVYLFGSFVALYLFGNFVAEEWFETVVVIVVVVVV